MLIIEELEALESAEEFFEYFDLPYDPQRLKVIRLHLLKAYREKLLALPKDLDEDQWAAQAKEALAKAWCEMSVPGAKAFVPHGGCAACKNECTSKANSFDKFDNYTPAGR